MNLRLMTDVCVLVLCDFNIRPRHVMYRLKDLEMKTVSTAVRFILIVIVTCFFDTGLQVSSPTD